MPTVLPKENRTTAPLRPMTYVEVFRATPTDRMRMIKDGRAREHPLGKDRIAVARPACLNLDFPLTPR